jgi:hypothetical protein
VTGLIGSLGEERGTLEVAREARHPPDPLPRKFTILLPTLIHDAVELLKASLKAVVADERTVDDPRDLTEKTPVQTGFYAHRCQASRTFYIRPGGPNS